MRTTQLDLDRGKESQTSVGHAANQRRLWRVCKGLQALAPPGSWKKVWDKKRSPLWVYVTPSISEITTNCGPFWRIKAEIYFDKEVFRLFIEFRKSWVYNTFYSYFKFNVRSYLHILVKFLKWLFFDIRYYNEYEKLLGLNVRESCSLYFYIYIFCCYGRCMFEREREREWEEGKGERERNGERER